MATDAQSATESDDLDREVDEGLGTAYEWFGLGDGYQRDTVFHIAVT
jgi:hypothetical protein